MVAERPKNYENPKTKKMIQMSKFKISSIVNLWQKGCNGGIAFYSLSSLQSRDKILLPFFEFCFGISASSVMNSILKYLSGHLDRKIKSFGKRGISRFFFFFYSKYQVAVSMPRRKEADLSVTAEEVLSVENL